MVQNSAQGSSYVTVKELLKKPFFKYFPELVKMDRFQATDIFIAGK